MSVLNDSKRMGKGLDALFNKPIVQVPTDKNSILDIEINQIEPNPFQPRKYFSEENIEELAQSILSQGLLQPITLRRKDGVLQIVSGERRWRAFKKLGESVIPAHIIEDINDEKMLELAIIENIQREDLNPLELCESYSLLMENCGLNQEQVAEHLGKKRSSIANILRLRKLPQIIKDALLSEQISFGHAKAILGLERQDLMEQLFHLVVKKDLTVRKTEDLIKDFGTEKPVEEHPQPKIDPVFITDQEKKLADKISGHPVRIKIGKNEQGTINIKFTNVDELKDIMKILNG